MDRLGVKATNSKAKAKARGVKAKDLAPEAKAKAKDTPAGLEAPRGQGRGLEDSISENHTLYIHTMLFPSPFLSLVMLYPSYVV